MNKIVVYTSALMLLLSFASCKKDKPDSNNPVVEEQTTPWPKWMFRPWIWEGASTQQSAKQIVDDYLSHDIPVGAIIIDSPWETDYNTFHWDSSLFSDPAEMVRYFHSKDVRVFCWITGGIDTNVHPLYDYARDHDFFMKKNASSGPAIVKWWKPTRCSLIDFYNPEAVAWWKSLMDKTLAYGIDGWKCDGSDFLLYADFPTTYFYSPYLQGNIPSRNDYSDKYYRLFHDYTREKLGKDRVITCRPIDNYGYPFSGDVVAFCPKDISFACWVGDQDATFDGMKAALGNMYESAAYGYLSFGSDIGGYRTDPNNPTWGRSKKLFIRWAQLGAFSGIMENGGGGEHRPWMFDDETNTIYSNLAKLRLQMIPYLMKTAEARYNAGVSMVSFFNNTDYSYLMGDDMFVAPVWDETGFVTVNFPAGSNWVYLYNKSQTYTGGTSQTFSMSVNEFPVFVKEGSDLVTTLTP
jgi:alpha-glucosidase (family GH31 glycosyl hydrolase)